MVLKVIAGSPLCFWKIWLGPIRQFKKWLKKILFPRHQMIKNDMIKEVYIKTIEIWLGQNSKNIQKPAFSSLGRSDPKAHLVLRSQIGQVENLVQILK